jgi:hypothetical protein
MFLISYNYVIDAAGIVINPTRRVAKLAVTSGQSRTLFTWKVMELLKYEIHKNGNPVGTYQGGSEF